MPLNLDGWFLVTREESNHKSGKKAGEWYIAWHEMFTRKRSALQFARKNRWHPPYKAVRGTITVQKPPR